MFWETVVGKLQQTLTAAYLHLYVSWEINQLHVIFCKFTLVVCLDLLYVANKYLNGMKYIYREKTTSVRNS